MLHIYLHSQRGNSHLFVIPSNSPKDYMQKPTFFRASILCTCTNIDACANMKPLGDAHIYTWGFLIEAMLVVHIPTHPIYVTARIPSTRHGFVPFLMSELFQCIASKCCCQNPLYGQSDLPPPPALY